MKIADTILAIKYLLTQDYIYHMRNLAYMRLDWSVKRAYEIIENYATYTGIEIQNIKVEDDFIMCRCLPAMWRLSLNDFTGEGLEFEDARNNLKYNIENNKKKDSEEKRLQKMVESFPFCNWGTNITEAWRYKNV